jgi:hypothetical protein
MELASSLAPLDQNLGISGANNDRYGVPIGLCTIRHEAFEMRLGDFIPSHDVVEVMPGKHLSIIVFGLEVAPGDGHDALVGLVIYVASHGGPSGHAFDMVGHNPSIIEILA